eukprot:CAMPEP_0205808384 /NCGR_PEP_ID=MMETSP0205-20121125/12326_1 /ASSEMBLY_ACC=CAM_ASM_000278 /TAXON_ID=36767 /ORGANISM="Euplotes focardii, Strain TN1" /LENGTH=157 /DNA_ID=CAMNT_0053083985 /DNA_START=321 /DNA_END=794 /DNA_ORIENTATION=-
MKLGATIFNRIEESRLMVNHGYYILPYLSGSIAFISLMVFAKFTPIKSKLYKELGISCGIGLGSSYGYIYQQKCNYWAEVSRSYDELRKLMDKHPELYRIEEDQGVIKNFGNNTFNTLEDVGDDWEESAKTERGVFEGTADEDGEMNRLDLIKRLTG